MAGTGDARWPSGGDEGDERGFTLIELMVVLLIMAILLAIAIPTFFGVRTSAGYRSAQSDLVNATVSLKAIFAGTAQGGYPTLPSLVAQAGLVEPELTFTSGSVTSSPAHSLSVAESTDGYILVLTDQSADGHCWFVEINEEQMPTIDGVVNATPTQGVTFGESKNIRANCNAGTIGGASIFTGWGPSFPSF